LSEYVYVVEQARILGGSATALGGAVWMDAAMRLRSRKSMCSSLAINFSKNIRLSISFTSEADGK
jgi:hypothetical protein